MRKESRLIDEKGKPNVIPSTYYFDDMSGKIYTVTFKTIKKVLNLRKNNIIAYCIDDSRFQWRGVRGKATVKIHEDVNHDIPIAKKYLMKNTGSLDNPIAKYVLTETERENAVILEITPKYYSTWRSAVPVAVPVN